MHFKCSCFFGHPVFLPTIWFGTYYAASCDWIIALYTKQLKNQTKNQARTLSLLRIHLPIIAKLFDVISINRSYVIKALAEKFRL